VITPWLTYSKPAMFAKEDGTCRQILVSQYATDSSQVAVMLPLVPETEKPNPWSLKSAKHSSI
jgi:hypothetical protein